MDNKEEIFIDERKAFKLKTSYKVKLTLAIIASILVIATVTTLLIGHFWFDWFKSDNYKIDADIGRKVYQANYFSEKKKISSQFTMTDGKVERKEYILDSNFVVFLTDKKENMNTAALVLLSSVATVEEEVRELPHLNIFDKNQIKELEANPEGAQYPMAVFKFDDDGKIEEIKLPNNMNEYNAQLILELIEKVIPKLSRSRKEDISNGLEIKTTKSKNKRTIVQSEAPRQFETFEGSRISRRVKTEIEDEQITNIESEGNVHLHQSEPEDKEDFIFGPTDFKFDSKSEISSKEVKYDEKENVELVNKLADKFTLIDSKELLQSIKDKKEEKKKEEEKIISEENTPLRQLTFDMTASKTFNLATLKFLGQTITIKYVVSVTPTKAIHKVVISSNLGFFEFGNTGCYGVMSKTYQYDRYIFKFIVPNFPLISVGCYVKGSLSWMLSFQARPGIPAQLFAMLAGNLKLGAEVKAGWDVIASLSAYAEGTVVDAAGSVTITQGQVQKATSFSLRMGNLEAGIRGCLFWVFRATLWSITIFKGWKII